MPTYEFRCPNGHEFEQFYRSIGTAAVEVHCPVCGEIAKRELSAGAGLVFKGSGFYITDYGKDGKGPAKQVTETSAPEKSKGEKSSDADKGAAAAKTSEAATSSSAESKPSASSESKPAPKESAPKPEAPAPAKSKKKE
jgi:putative FmdB family regulatory protein